VCCHFNLQVPAPVSWQSGRVLYYWSVKWRGLRDSADPYLLRPYQVVRLARRHLPKIGQQTNGRTILARNIRLVRLGDVKSTTFQSVGRRHKWICVADCIHFIFLCAHLLIVTFIRAKWFTCPEWTYELSSDDIVVSLLTTFCHLLFSLFDRHLKLISLASTACVVGVFSKLVRFQPVSNCLQSGPVSPVSASTPLDNRIKRIYLAERRSRRCWQEVRVEWSLDWCCERAGEEEEGETDKVGYSPGHFKLV
jgi:hypothetical protein